MTRPRKRPVFGGKPGFLVLAGLMLAWNAGAAAQTLERELGTILVDHPQVQGAMKTIEAARYGINRARGPMFPKINVTGDSGPEKVDTPPTRARCALPSGAKAPPR